MERCSVTQGEYDIWKTAGYQKLQTDILHDDIVAISAFVLYIINGRINTNRPYFFILTISQIGHSFYGSSEDFF